MSEGKWENIFFRFSYGSFIILLDRECYENWIMIYRVLVFGIVVGLGKMFSRYLLIIM